MAGVRGNRARAGLCGSLCAAVLLGAVGSAEASGSPPPGTAELRRATEHLLSTPAFADPASRRAGGDADADPLLSDRLYLTLYGAPQLVNTELGKHSPRGSARRVLRQSRPYERIGERDVVSGFDLIGVVANSTPGRDRKYRTRQPDAVIGAYLDQARRIDGRLMLDIQPGRSSAVREVGALEDWFAEPDVDAAIDPEWNVGPRGVPGRTTGSITAAEINAASRRLDRIVEREGLPPKVLVVHQFTKRMIRNRRAIRQRDGIQVVLNFDGIGSRAAKVAGYEDLASGGSFNGLSIFYELDPRPMAPGIVLGLMPPVDFLLYQ